MIFLEWNPRRQTWFEWNYKDIADSTGKDQLIIDTYSETTWYIWKNINVQSMVLISGGKWFRILSGPYPSLKNVLKRSKNFLPILSWKQLKLFLFCSMVCSCSNKSYVWTQVKIWKNVYIFGIHSNFLSWHFRVSRNRKSILTYAYSSTVLLCRRCYIIWLTSDMLNRLMHIMILSTMLSTIYQLFSIFWNVTAKDAMELKTISTSYFHEQLSL